MATHLPSLRCPDGQARDSLGFLGAALRGDTYPETSREVTSLEDLLVPKRRGERQTAPADSPSASPVTWGPLARLFACAEAVSREELDGALPSGVVEDLRRLGMVMINGGAVRASFRIQRLGRHLVVSDWPAAHRPKNYVPGVTASGLTLAHLTPTRPVGTFLDLGSGCGLQAVLAADHAIEVVATDVNSRAVSLARASAELNDLVNLKVLPGSWLTPVAAERFDLVVCNPPFVVSPEHRYLYRDGVAGEAHGEELCARLIGELPRHLTPGGIAVILVSWSRRGNEDWAERPRRWLRSVRAERLVIRYESLTPEQYAWAFTSNSSDELRAGPSSTFDRWVRHYERLGIEELCVGAVALRRPSKEMGRRTGPVIAEAAAHGPGSRAGEQLEAMFEGRAWGDRQDGAKRGVVSLVEGHEVIQRLRFAGGRYLADEVFFELPEGAGVQARLDPRLLSFVLSIDGSRPVDGLVSPNAQAGSGRQAEETGALKSLARAGFLHVGAGR